MREVLPLRPDGHRGEGPGRKKLDPCSNSSRTLQTGEAGSAEGINTQRDEAGWSNLSITSCLHFECKRMYTVCVCVCVRACVYRCVGQEKGKGKGKRFKKRKKEGGE